MIQTCGSINNSSRNIGNHTFTNLHKHYLATGVTNATFIPLHYTLYLKSFCVFAYMCIFGSVLNDFPVSSTQTTNSDMIYAKFHIACFLVFIAKVL